MSCRCKDRARVVTSRSLSTGFCFTILTPECSGGSVCMWPYEWQGKCLLALCTCCAWSRGLGAGCHYRMRQVQRIGKGRGPGCPPQESHRCGASSENCSKNLLASHRHQPPSADKTGQHRLGRSIQAPIAIISFLRHLQLIGVGMQTVQCGYGLASTQL